MVMWRRHIIGRGTRDAKALGPPHTWCVLGHGKEVGVAGIVSGRESLRGAESEAEGLKDLQTNHS